MKERYILSPKGLENLRKDYRDLQVSLEWKAGGVAAVLFCLYFWAFFSLPLEVMRADSTFWGFLGGLLFFWCLFRLLVQVGLRKKVQIQPDAGYVLVAPGEGEEKQLVVPGQNVLVSCKDAARNVQVLLGNPSRSFRIVAQQRKVVRGRGDGRTVVWVSGLVLDVTIEFDLTAAGNGPDPAWVASALSIDDKWGIFFSMVEASLEVPCLLWLEVWRWVRKTQTPSVHISLSRPEGDTDEGRLLRLIVQKNFSLTAALPTIRSIQIVTSDRVD